MPNTPLKRSLLAVYLLWAGLLHVHAQVDDNTHFVVDSSAHFVVDSIEYKIANAFDDNRKVTRFDAWLFSVGNHLRFKTRPSVLAQNIFFTAGDTVNLYDFAESERWLRRQKFLSDAHISLRQGEQGENIVEVQSSDMWTTVIPIALSKPGDRWLWQLGLLENNFLGVGKSAGLYYGRGEENITWLVNNSDGKFWQNNYQLDLSYTWNADGFNGEFLLARPFLLSHRDEWAYTIAGQIRQMPRLIYWSENTLPVAKEYISSQNLQLVNAAGDSVKFPTYKPGVHANHLFSWQNLRRDSLSYRLARSWGGARVAKVRAGFNYQKNASENPTIQRPVFREGDEYFAVDSSDLLQMFLHLRQDVRFGLGLEFSRLNYTKRHNFSHIKWTEDVQEGWVISAYIAKNQRALGASNNHWYGEADGQISLGNSLHYFLARAQQQAYWQFGSSEINESRGQLKFEYIYKPTHRLGTAWSAEYKNINSANFAESYFLGANYGLEGFRAFFLAGIHSFYSRLEQRWYPDVEVLTLLPVFAAFVNAGQTAPTWDKLLDRNLQWSAGISLRVGLSKSVEGVINHLNLVWPLNGPLAGSKWPMLAILASVSM